MDQRDLSASLLSARSFSAFSDEGDHVHDDGGRGERRQRLLLRILGLSFEEPRAFWRWYRAVYGFLVLAATVGYGICYAGVLALADGGAADVCARKAVYAALALAAYAVALVDARRGNLPPPSQDPAHDSRVQRVPPPPPPPARLLGCGFALFVAAHASATCRNVPASPLRPALFAAADLFAFLPRLGPVACLVLRCGALERRVHVVHDDRTHELAKDAVVREMADWRAYVALSGLFYALLGARDVANAFGLYGPPRDRDPLSIADDTLHAALVFYHVLAPLCPVADLNRASRHMLGRFVRQRDIHAYLLLKHDPPTASLFGFAPTRPKILAVAVALVGAYACASLRLVLATFPF